MKFKGMQRESSFIRLTTIATFFLATCAAAYAQTPTPGPPPPNVVSSSAGNIKIERLATLEQPWGMALLPDGRLLITEKPGRVRVWANGQLSEPLQGVPRAFYRGPSDQGGMLDVEADPDFARNGFVYLSYVEAAEPQPPGAQDEGDRRFGRSGPSPDIVVRGGVVARGKLSGNQLQDVQVIWRQEPKTVGRGHFGNRIVFSPDGKLFITSGERMRFDPAHDLASNLGKVVRVNKDGSVPADNPFAGREGARGDVWSYGHRNMLAAAIDATGRLWVVEMGPLGGDELNLVQPGKNYGWPLVSNGDNYDNSMIPDHPSRRDLQAPVRSWSPVISPSGALFYTGALFPAWRGHMLLGGLSSRSLIRLAIDGERVAVEERIDMKRRIRDVLQAPDGALLVIVDDPKGDLLRLTPAR
jgi:glucose/arabinose dehydrogenase